MNATAMEGGHIQGQKPRRFIALKPSSREGFQRQVESQTPFNDKPSIVTEKRRKEAPDDFTAEIARLRGRTGFTRKVDQLRRRIELERNSKLHKVEPTLGANLASTRTLSNSLVR